MEVLGLCERRCYIREVLIDWDDGKIAQCRMIWYGSETNPILIARESGDLREKYLVSHHSKHRFVLIQLNCPLGMFPLLFSSQKENSCNATPCIGCISFAEESFLLSLCSVENSVNWLQNEPFLVAKESLVRSFLDLLRVCQCPLWLYLYVVLEEKALSFKGALHLYKIHSPLVIYTLVTQQGLCHCCEPHQVLAFTLCLPR